MTKNLTLMERKIYLNIVLFVAVKNWVFDNKCDLLKCTVFLIIEKEDL